LSSQTVLDRNGGIVNRPPRTKTEGVRLEDRFPFGFQGQFHEALHHPIFHGSDAQRPHLAVGFRDEHPTHRRRAVVLQAQTVLEQILSVLGGVTYDSSNARSVATAVL